MKQEGTNEVDKKQGQVETDLLLYPLLRGERMWLDGMLNPPVT
jgi:hypothetical protein